MSKRVWAKLALLGTVLLALCPLNEHVASAQTTLTAGDIAIIGYNSVDPDRFAFVLLEDVETGTEIKFTDNGWTADDTFRATEGILLWTASLDRSAGEVIVYQFGGEFSSFDEGFALNQSGDQILAYQASETDPVFIYAVNDQGSAAWQADTTSSNDSALPPGLTNGTTAVALNEDESGIYTGITSGTKQELLAAISDPNNWTMSSTSQTMPTGPFDVTPTAVDLASFTASPLPGAVLLRWETAAEIDTLGFHLYRSLSPEGEALRLTETMIPAESPGSPAGARYEYTDESARGGVTYYYWLEDVDTQGRVVRHGPLAATADVHHVYLPLLLR